MLTVASEAIRTYLGKQRKQQPLNQTFLLLWVVDYLSIYLSHCRSVMYGCINPSCGSENQTAGQVTEAAIISYSCSRKNSGPFIFLTLFWFDSQWWQKWKHVFGDVCIYSKSVLTETFILFAPNCDQLIFSVILIVMCWTPCEATEDKSKPLHL